MRIPAIPPLLLVALLGCSSALEPDSDSSLSPQISWPDCATVPEEFILHVRHVLADSAKMFTEYPDPTPFTCELLVGLEEAMKDDSVRYHFEHLSQRYWRTDPHNANVERYIARHLEFHLAIAATGHFFADVRIMGLRQLQEYRRMRPLVCTTKTGSAKLERQDREAVGYLLKVLDNTPWSIDGSENATIHGVYITEIARTLDLFTGQHHVEAKDLDLTDARLRNAQPEWQAWLVK